MILLLLFLAGLALGSLATWLGHAFVVRGYKRLSQEIIEKAEMEAREILAKASFACKEEAFNREKEHFVARQKLQKEEERLKTREDKLEGRMNLVEKKLSEIDKKEAIMNLRRERIDEEKKRVRLMETALQRELEKISLLTSSEAKEILLNKVHSEVKMEMAKLTKKALVAAQEEAEQKAATIIATAINRIASSQVSEVTLTTVALPNDEMKGRIIGKEGRNIRALELATGINFLIDDTPGAVVLSGFDPIRKQIAKVALTELVLDGRIHPTRIEEVVAKSRDLVHKQIKTHGEDAAMRAGLVNLHQEILTLLGKLKFRYSFGQNVLDHSLEVAHIMGIMAAELGLDVACAKRIGLLHDMGKALSHEVEGSHALIGSEFALKFGESEQVANGIACHHGEVEPITVEGSLCSAADALSAARPGARVEAIEHYLKRLHKLEAIAHALPGVDKAFAMQAGREIRVIVHPDSVDDEAMINLAREVAKRVENDVSYPGKIKVTVIREKRATEYAL